MTIIIEVGNEAGGLLTSKRMVMRSEDYGTPQEMEAAAIYFIREAGRTNEAVLQAAEA